MPFNFGFSILLLVFYYLTTYYHTYNMRAILFFFFQFRVDPAPRWEGGRGRAVGRHAHICPTTGAGVRCGRGAKTPQPCALAGL